MSSMPEKKRILVVGAGSSGLTAIKACLEEEQIPVCFEKTQDIGGLWRYSEQPSPPGTAGIYRSLVINTCKEMLAFSDFPVPEQLPQFLTHDKVLLYFRLYAQHFNLLPHVRFNTEVRHVRKSDNYDLTGRWTVTYILHVRDDCAMKCDNVQETVVSDDISRAVDELNDDISDPSDESSGGQKGSACVEERSEQQAKPSASQDYRKSCTPKACRVVTEEFDGVMVCTGHHTVPYMPSVTGADLYKGRLLHSQDYKIPDPFSGQRVLVVGIGNSAVDIASDLAKTAKVFLSTRRGAWIVPRTSLWGIPADMLANSRAVFSLPARLLEWCVEKQANLRMDHALLGLVPKHRLLGAHPTINDEIPFHLMSGRVEVRPDIAQIYPQGVQFQDGSTEDVDAIIMATGYDYRLDFVDSEVIRVEQNRVRLYLYAFPPNLPHPTLAVIGLVQAIGAVMPISEMQSRLFVSLMLAQVRLPPREKMERDIDKKLLDMNTQYYESRRHTLQTFWITYMDQVASHLGARPRLGRLLFTDPELAIKCYLGPCLPAQYRLQGPHTWPPAARFIKDTAARTHRRSGRTPTVHPQRDTGECLFGDNNNRSSEKCRQGQVFGGCDDTNINNTARPKQTSSLKRSAPPTSGCLTLNCPLYAWWRSKLWLTLLCLCVALCAVAWWRWHASNWLTSGDVIESFKRDGVKSGDIH